MDLTPLPIAAFIAPDGKNFAAVAQLCQQVMDLVLTEASQAEMRSPLPPGTDLGLPIAIPSDPTPEAELLSQLQMIIQQSMNAAHPGYIGHMDSLPTTMSILGDLVVAMLNNNLLSVELSPVFSRLEPQLTQQIAALFGLGPASGGLLVGGGSLANLQALAIARNLKLNVSKTGLAGLRPPPVFFGSQVAHTSLQKAAMVLGLGSEAAIPVAVDCDEHLDVEDLRQKMGQALTAGQQPFAVVATVGTTTTGNIDPLAEIHALAQEFDLWFHVDAAYGGAIVFSESHRDRLIGITQADSITFNPQKWLYVTKTCAMLLVRDLAQLRSAFQVGLPYMQQADDGFTNLGEISIQGTRHADVLKLWLSLRHLGQRSYGHLVDESYRLTAYFVTQVKARSFLVLASSPEMNIVCFRGVPDWVDATRWDQWNRDLQQNLLTAGFFLSIPRYRGALWLRSVLLNPYTDEGWITKLFEQMDQFVARSQATPSTQGT